MVDAGLHRRSGDGTYAPVPVKKGAPGWESVQNGMAATAKAAAAVTLAALTKAERKRFSREPFRAQVNGRYLFRRDSGEIVTIGVSGCR